MVYLRTLRELTPTQRNTVLASFLGWTLNSFDFFVLVFVLKDVAETFNTTNEAVSIAIALTLVLRPVGAYIFGQLADRFGRRRILVIDILLFSIIEVASGFAPGLTSFLILRALFGIAMGGEWGVGAALTMESIPIKARGAVSGILQAGYPIGNLLAAALFGSLFEIIGWRGMFIVGGLPALLVLFIRAKVPESPTWQARGPARVSMIKALRTHWPRFLYAVGMMAVFSFATHGTQDIYPTMLREQRGLSPAIVGTIGVCGTVGGFIGTLFWGAYSERAGRRRAIITAMLCAFLVIPVWAFSPNLVLLAAGALVMQFLVQGPAGVLPAYLNELSPNDVRGTFPGFSYQTGTLFTSFNATMQIALARKFDDNYALALAITAAVVTLTLSAVLVRGYETRGVSFDRDENETAPGIKPGAV